MFCSKYHAIKEVLSNWYLDFDWVTCKKEGKDQESIQSITTPDSGWMHQWESLKSKSTIFQLCQNSSQREREREKKDGID